MQMNHFIPNHRQPINSHKINCSQQINKSRPVQIIIDKDLAIRKLIQQNQILKQKLNTLMHHQNTLLSNKTSHLTNSPISQLKNNQNIFNPHNTTNEYNQSSMISKRNSFQRSINYDEFAFIQNQKRNYRKSVELNLQQKHDEMNNNQMDMKFKDKIMKLKTKKQNTKRYMDDKGQDQQIIYHQVSNPINQIIIEPKMVGCISSNQSIHRRQMSNFQFIATAPVSPQNSQVQMNYKSSVKIYHPEVHQNQIKYENKVNEMSQIERKVEKNQQCQVMKIDKKQSKEYLNKKDVLKQNQEKEKEKDKDKQRVKNVYESKKVTTNSKREFPKFFAKTKQVKEIKDNKQKTINQLKNQKVIEQNKKVIQKDLKGRIYLDDDESGKTKRKVHKKSQDQNIFENEPHCAKRSQNTKQLNQFSKKSQSTNNQKYQFEQKIDSKLSIEHDIIKLEREKVKQEAKQKKINIQSPIQNIPKKKLYNEVYCSDD